MHRIQRSIASRFFLLSIFVGALPAGVRAASLFEVFYEKTRQAVQQKYPGAEVQFQGLDAITDTEHFKAILAIDSVQYIEEKPQEKTVFELQGSSESNRVHMVFQVRTSIFVPTRIAREKIIPGQILRPDLFTVVKLNPRDGMMKEYRGIIAPASLPLHRVWARQTILPGSPLLTTAIERTPDIRRGDRVKIRLEAGELTLSTSGIAQENGYIGERLKIITQVTKRELVGVLKSDSTLEVAL